MASSGYLNIDSPIVLLEENTVKNLIHRPAAHTNGGSKQPFFMTSIGQNPCAVYGFDQGQKFQPDADVRRMPDMCASGERTPMKRVKRSRH